MTRLMESTRLKLMMIHGLTMLGLGLALFYIRATMTNAFFYIFGGAFALLLVAASLLLIAGVDWICAAGFGCRQRASLRGFLFLSTAVAACSVVLILYSGATVQMLCFLIAVYAFSLSISKFALARSWNGTRVEQTIMYLLAIAGLVFAGALLSPGGKDDRQSLAVMAAYSIYMGLQMLLTMYFLQQHVPIAVESASRFHRVNL